MNALSLKLSLSLWKIPPTGLSVLGSLYIRHATVMFQENNIIDLHVLKQWKQISSNDYHTGITGNCIHVGTHTHTFSVRLTAIFQVDPSWLNWCRNIVYVQWRHWKNVFGKPYKKTTIKTNILDSDTQDC